MGGWDRGAARARGRLAVVGPPSCADGCAEPTGFEGELRRRLHELAGDLAPPRVAPALVAAAGRRRAARRAAARAVAGVVASVVAAVVLAATVGRGSAAPARPGCPPGGQRGGGPVVTGPRGGVGISVRK